MQCFVQESPRSLALVSNEDALILRCIPNDVFGRSDGLEQNALNPRVSEHDASRWTIIAEFCPWPEVASKGSYTSLQANNLSVRYSGTTYSEAGLSVGVDISPNTVYGCLGLICVDGNIFVCLLNHVSKIAALKSDENICRIYGVFFYCLSDSKWDSYGLTGGYPGLEAQTRSNAGDPFNTDISTENIVEHPCAAIRKLLSGGSFYCSTDFDLTTRLQQRYDVREFTWNSHDFDFMWNFHMIEGLFDFRSNLQTSEKLRFDKASFLICAIRGYAETVDVSLLPMQPASLTIVSRLSCRRAGTRYNSRGIDDAGNVSNFVETEIILRTRDLRCSFVIIRGSVPVFWEQEGIQLFSARIEVTRSMEASNAAFKKHMDSLITKYGTVHIINLLGTAKSERLLTEEYEQQLKAPDEFADQVRYTRFDYHSRVKTFEDAKLLTAIVEASTFTSQGFFLLEKEEAALNMQTGVFRVNCLDCLDRTNVSQDILSQKILMEFLKHRHFSVNQDFWIKSSHLWANNGDALSRIYAGTGALKSSHTRKGKMSLSGALNDFSKSVGRAYINNFQDKSRQQTVDLLLGRLPDQLPVSLYDPINTYLMKELYQKSGEYSSQETIKIFAGTYNVNGRNVKSIDQWLSPDGLEPTAHIYSIALQEIVELTGQQIMSTDNAARKYWEDKIRNFFQSHGSNYVMLRTGQLVGVMLLLFVRRDVLHNIKNVEGTVYKLGLGGFAGNKGAVAVRMDYGVTSVCFVAAHFAAGYTNFDERNRDYFSISHSLRFPRGRKIEGHDAIIWQGDFNYRIANLSYEQVVQTIKCENLKLLFDNDQLNLQMISGTVFVYYNEAPITFPPTYKFDVGTNKYDTTDKARVPAWTDRILSKGKGLSQSSYSIAQMYDSDHRPVYAEFRLDVTVIDEARRQKLKSRIREKLLVQFPRGRIIGTTDMINRNTVKVDQDRDRDVLPAPSSDRQKWWLDNGQKAAISYDSISQKPNPNRPSNPFIPSDEPYFIDSQAPPLPARKTILTQTNSTPLNVVAPPLPSRPSSMHDNSSLIDLHNSTTAQNEETKIVSNKIRKPICLMDDVPEHLISDADQSNYNTTNVGDRIKQFEKLRLDSQPVQPSAAKSSLLD